MPSTITLLSVIQWAQIHIRNAPLVGAGGIANEPGLSICNNVLQTLLSSPNNWRFNKYSVPFFTTIPYQQDYVCSGATLQVAGKGCVFLNSVGSSTPGLTQSGTTVTATFSDFAPNGIQGASPTGTPALFAAGDAAVITGAAQGAYNGTFTLTGAPNTTSVTYTTTGGLSNDGGQGLANIGWMERATLQDFLSTATVKPVHDIEVVSGLTMESIIQPPIKVCFLVEDINTSVTPPLTNVTFRFWPIPSSQIWGAYLYYQGKSPIKTALTNNWSPWPDELGYVLRSGVKAAAYDYFEDPRMPMAEQKWQIDIQKALDIKQQELRAEAYFPDLPIQRGG